MAKKITGWKTKGMNRDLSVSAFNPEFSFENMNLRLSTNEGNTLLSWVNEKGTQQYIMWDGSGNAPEYYYQVTNPEQGQSGTFYSLYGNVIGTAVLNHQLVLFTTRTYNSGNDHQDRIYKCEFEDDAKKHLAVTLLFKGNLKLDEEHPIETLVSFEAEHIQKVYWVDGKNQPRMINIAGDPSKWQGNNTAFDFVPAFNGGNISVVNHPSGGGLFAPGVIQYCFTYVNKWGQQSNIVDVSPLYYLSHSDRGASPESKTGNLFNITISNADDKFDLIRIYSIQRTSLNAVPIVRQLDDVTITGNTATCIDNGTEGLIVDPTELLYIGGKEIVALTMADKDNTLFLGNIQQKGNILPSGLPKPHVNFYGARANDESDDPEGKEVDYGAGTGVYCYKNLIKNHSQKDITTFKGGEWYRFGYQLQRKTGEWTEPIVLEDKQNTIYPSTSVSDSTATLAIAACDLDFGTIDMSEFKKVRPLVIYPNMSERNVICQGVLNPTVFNVLDRKDNSPYAQASWYFRPIMKHVKNAEAETVAVSNDTVEVTIDPLTTASDTLNYDAAIAAGLVGTDWLSYDFSDLFNFATKGYLANKYVVVVSITSNLNSILERGYLLLHEETWDALNSSIIGTVDRKNIVAGNYRYDFDGAINLGNNRWAFTSRNPWPVPSSATETESFGDNNLTFKKYKSCSYNEVTYQESTDKPFPICTFLSRTDNNIYYYQEQSDLVTTEDQSFTFRFYTGAATYSIKFENISTGSDFNRDINYHGGSGLRYQNMESLFCASELTEQGNNTDTTQLRRNVEIQGSLKIRNSVFGNNLVDNVKDNKPHRTGGDKEIKSNTQFFIDQSIVTLNSPDIEFDTDVQNYPMEGSGLKLRIVGCIPITANASAFSIETGSSMMPLGSNKPIGKGIIEQMVYYSKKTADTKISFGTGVRSSQNIVYNNISDYAGNRLVADYLWNDALIMSVNDSDVECQSSDIAHDFLIHPWHRSGSLNNDFRGKDTASSLLKTKKESNILFSTHSVYHNNFPEYGSISSQMVLTENEEIMNYRLPVNYNEDFGNAYFKSKIFSGINYFPNINKILYNEDGYTPWVKELYNNETVEDVTTPISMKYKSTSHAVIAMQVVTTNNTYIPALPNTRPGNSTTVYGHPYWDKECGEYRYYSSTISNNIPEYNYLWLGELQRGANTSPFTATEENNRWLIGGDAVSINSTTVDNTTTYSASLVWDRGDTYYQRYDCLKTYPFSTEDPNQIIEILSFMCETRVNLDGRYDKNRGLLDNTNIHPKNFNLLNDIYSQKDNFFVSRKLSDDGANNTYPNYITYSKTKTAGADVDLWTNVNLGSVLEMDGDNGEVRDLEKFNNQLICFQDTGISQILYNENVQINSAEGVPIEIANSGKVQGKRYFTNTIGCSNKWSIANTPSGIYFIDSNDKSIYKFDGQLVNLSLQGGMNSWSKQNLGYQNPWNPLFPYMTGDNSAFVTYYDRQNQDILFINKDKALAYSEKLGTFTSFYDYGKIPYFVNFDDTGIWIKHNGATDGSIASDLYLHQGGNYCKFFGVNKPYWMTLVGNPEPQMDKIFTNLEFRACVDGDGTVANNKFTPTLPFDSLETWDEYQHGIANLGARNGHAAQLHHSSAGGNDTLKRKFRIWRCDIPRDNVEIITTTPPDLPEEPTPEQTAAYTAALAAFETYKKEQKIGISRFTKHPNDRMRNPWLYLKLMKNAESNSNKALSRAEIHDIMMTYFS